MRADCEDAPAGVSSLGSDTKMFHSRFVYCFVLLQLLLLLPFMAVVGVAVVVFLWVEWRVWRSMQAQVLMLSLLLYSYYLRAHSIQRRPADFGGLAKPKYRHGGEFCGPWIWRRNQTQWHPYQFRTCSCQRLSGSQRGFLRKRSFLCIRVITAASASLWAPFTITLLLRGVGDWETKQQNLARREWVLRTAPSVRTSYLPTKTSVG